MIYLFVEGSDDDMLVDMLYDIANIEHKIIQYANRSKKSIKAYIDSIRCMECEFLFFADADSKSIAQKKHIISERYCINSDVVVITKEEIESWYLAGLPEENCNECGIRKHVVSTDNISKEDFDNLLLKGYIHSASLAAIVDYFNLELACKRNISFNKFYLHYLI